MGLAEQDLAYMVSRLEVPLVIKEILEGKQALCDETHYALHETLSELQPDTALLAIVLSMQAITKHSHSPFSMSLNFEASRLIQDYGSLWISNAKNNSPSLDRIFDVIIHVAEDLESIAELLELHESSLKEQNQTITELCQILYIQARAQALVAQTFMDMVDAACEETTQPPTQTGSNVVAFPVQGQSEQAHI